MTTNDIQVWKQQLAADPHNRDAFTSLAERFVEARKWQDLLRLYEAQEVLSREIPNYWEGLVENLEIITPELEELPERAQVTMEIGKIFEHQIGHTEKAMVYYQKAFKTWPYKTEALDLARDIYARKGNWKLVIRLYQLELQVAKEPAHQARVCGQMGRIYADELDEKDTGLQLLQKALELVPDDAFAASHVARLTHVKPAWEQEVERAAAALDEERNPRRKAALHVKLAELRLEHAQDAPSAEEHLKAALALDERSAEASRLLASLYRKAERFDALVTLLEAQADDAATSKDDRLNAWIELADLRQTRLHDEAGAVQAFEKVLELDPTHPAALRCAEAFYEQKQDWQALVALYENALRQKRRSDGENELLVQLGELFWKKIGNLEEAEKQFKRVRLANPKDERMLYFYNHYLRQEQNWKKLFSNLATLRQVVEDPQQQLALAVEMAQIANDEMASPEKAIDVWKSVLKIDPENAEARKHLHDLYQSAQKWNALLEFYKEDIAQLGDDDASPQAVAQKVALHLKMVEIYRDHLKLDVMVINTYNAILLLDPANEDAIDALAGRYEEGRRWNDLINVLGRKIDVVAQRAPQEAIPLLHRVAELWQQRLGNASQAIPVLERVLELHPQDPEAIAQLKGLYEHRRDWPSLLRVLDLEAANLHGAPLGHHLAQMADMARKRLGDAQQAQALHERVLAALEGEGDHVADPALYLASLEELEKVYDEQDDTDRLIGVLNRRLRVVTANPERIHVLQRLAELVREQGDDQRAVALWQEILRLEPDNDAALSSLTDRQVQRGEWDALEALYGGRGEWLRLFEILDAGALVAEDDATRVALYERMARVASEHLHDDQKVMLSLESILELQPANTDVALRLLPYYRTAGEAAKEVQANILLLDNDGGDPFTLTREIARLYGRALGDMEKAFDWEDRAFRMHPEDATLREHVENVARAAGRLAELVASYRQVAEQVEDDAVRHTLYRTVARTCYNDLDWLTDAVDYYERLLRADGADREAIDALLVLYRRLERWEDLLGAMERKVQLLDADAAPEATDLRFQIAELLQGPLGRRTDAVAPYEAILHTDRANLTALRGLKHIFQQEEDWSRMAEVTERELDLLHEAGEREQVEELLLQLGNLCEYQLEDADQAVTWYARLLGAPSASRGPAVSALEGLLEQTRGEGPRAVRVAALLEPVHRADSNVARLAEILEIQLRPQQDPDARAAALWELKSLYEDHLEDTHRAFGAAERLLDVTPADPRAWEELERLAGAADRWSRVADLYAALVPGASSLDADPWAFDLLRRQARIFEQELTQDTDARLAYETLLARDPADAQAIAQLEEVYRRLAAWPELVELLERRVTLAEGDDDQKAVLFAMASLQEDHLADADAAVQTLRRVTAIDPRDARAVSELERLLAHEGRWSEVVELLGSRIALADDAAARHALKFQLGAVLEAQLLDRAAAVHVYREIVLDDPAHADALAALERLSEALVQEGGPLDLRRAIDDTLEPLYTAAEQWERLVHTLNLKLGYAEGDDARVDLHVRAGRLERDRLARLDDAFQHLTAAVRLRFHDAALRAELEALADALDAHAQVVNLYEDLLVDVAPGDVELRFAALERIAHLQEHQLADVEAAIDAWRRVLDIDAAHAQALSALERLHEQQQQWVELVAICERKALLAEGDHRIALMHKVGRLQEGPLDDPHAAIDTFRRVLLERTGDPDALDALERLHLKLEQWRDLVQTLFDKVAQAEAPEAKRLLLLRIATVCEEQLEEPFEAIQIYRRILDLVPGDQESLDALDRLHAQHEQWIELVEILQRKLEHQPEPQAQAHLLFRLGQIQQDRLASVPEAIDTYAQVLERAPDHEEARAALRDLLNDPSFRFAASRVLEPRYRAESAHAYLVGLLELQLEDTAERAGRLTLLTEIASLHEHQLQSAPQAFEAARRAYLIDPLDPARQREIERLAADTGAWAHLVDTWEEALPELNDDSASLAVLLKIAAAQHDNLDDVDAAESTWRRALAQEPASLPALQALEDLLTRQTRWTDLIEILERKHQALLAVGQPDAAQAILFRIAQIFDEVLAQAPDAIDVYLRVLDAAPRDPAAVAALKRLYRAEARWYDLTALLLREIDAQSGDPGVVALRYELAQVYHLELRELAEAVEAYRRVLLDAPDHADAIAALESLFESGEERFTVSALLEPIYRRRGAWGPLASVLEVRLEEQSDEDARRGLLTQIARIREEKLGDKAQAFNAWERLVQEDPNLFGAWDQLERLAAATDAWSQVAAAYGDVLRDAFKVEDDARLALLLRRAIVLDERMDAIDDAREVYGEVLAYDEANTAAVDALERIHTRQESWDDLVALYRRSAELTSELDARRAWWFKIATLFEEVVLDAASAVDAYRQVLDIDPDNRVAVRSLERLYQAEEQWHDLADLYRREASVADNEDDAINLKQQLALVLAHELDELPEAIDIFRDILSLRPDHAPARRALEDLLRELGSRGDMAADLRLQIALLLQPLYDEATEWSRLIEVYEVQLEVIQDPAQRTEVFRKIAHLRETFQENPQGAFEAYSRAFTEDVASQELQAHLERLAGKLGAWEQLVRIYLEALSNTVDGPRMVELLHRIADLYLTRLDQPESAIGSYRQILDLEERDRKAVARLEELYAGREMWRDLVEVLERTVEFGEDALESKETLFRIAELQEKKLGDDDLAIETYRRVLDLDDEDVAAVEALERLYRRTAAWDNLISTLALKIELLSSDAEKVEVYRQMAEIYEVELQQPMEAVTTYRTIRDLKADDADAVRSLDRLYAREEMWPDLLDILEAQRDASADPDAVNAVEFRMGQLLEAHLYDALRAVEMYRQITDRSPDHTPAVEALENLLGQIEYRQAALDVLEPLYARKGEWRKLVDALELKLQDLYDPEEQRILLQKIAQIHEEKLDSRQLAFITWGRAFRAVPEADAPREHLERLAALMDNYDELVAVYEEKLEDLYDFELVKALSMRLGALYVEKLADRDAAIRRYARVVELEEYHAGALNALDTLYKQAEQWDELVTVLERKLQVVEPDQANDLKYRLAFLLEQRFSDLDRALAFYKDILFDLPDHTPSVEALERIAQDRLHRAEVAEVLEPLYMQAGAWEKVVTLLRMKLEITDLPAERANLLRQAAEIAEQRQSDKPQALLDIAAALREDAADLDLFREAERLAADLDAWGQVADLYDALAADVSDDYTRKELLLKVAAWAQDKLGQAERAEARYNAVLDMEADNEQALDALIRLYDALGDAQRLYDTLARKAEIIYDVVERRGLYSRMAELATESLQDVNLAIGAFERLRDIDDADPRALRALGDLYQQTGRHAELVEILRRRAELADSGEERLALWLRIGAVCRDHLHDTDGAVEAYRTALDIEPGHAEAMTTLEDLYRADARWDALQEILVQQLTFSDTDAQRHGLYLKSAQLAEERFDDVDGAIEAYRQLLLIEPRDAHAINQLERLYKKTQRWYDLQEIYLLQLEAITDPRDSVRLHVAISHLAAQHLADPVTAKEHLQKVLQLDPDNVDALGVLAVLYENDGEWEQAMTTLEKQIRFAADPARLAELYLRRGRIQDDHLANTDEARASYIQALDYDKGNADAMSALKALYRRAQSWPELVDLLHIEAEGVQDADERVKLYVEIAQIARDQMKDSKAAVRALEGAYRVNPDNLAVAEPLLQAYIDAGQTDRAEPILNGLITTLTESRKMKELFRFQHLRGQLAEQRGDVATAQTAYEAAYDIDATYIPNLLSLGRLYFRQEDWERSLKIFQTLLLHQMKIKEQEDKLDVYYYLGMVRVKTGDERRARDMFNRALAIDKTHEPTLKALEGL